MDPDPVMESTDCNYLERFESFVHKILTRVCAGCLRTHPGGVRMRCCPCKEVYYCSEKCQRAHWKEHKTVCDRKAK